MNQLTRIILGLTVVQVVLVAVILSLAPVTPMLAFNANFTGDEEVYLADTYTGLIFNLSQNPDKNDIMPIWSPTGQHLVFESSQNSTKNDIYLVDVQHGKIKRLSQQSQFYSSPSWSSEGQYVTFADDSSIYVVNLDTDDLYPVVVYQRERSVLQRPDRVMIPIWSPHNQQIAFVANPDGNSEIDVVDVKSHKVVNLSNSPDTIDTDPVWSPDGQFVAFLSQFETEYEVRVARIHDGKVEKVGATPVEEARYPNTEETKYPVRWSPDSRYLAFITQTEHGRALSLFAPEHNQSTMLQQCQPADLYAWSPDSSRLAFVSGHVPETQLCVYHLETNEVRQYFDSKINVFSIDWSPNSQHLAYHNAHTAIPGLAEINILDSHTFQPVRLTTPDLSLDYSPIWSPDGQNLIFISNVVLDDFEVYISDSSGEHIRRLFEFPKAPSNLAWQPVLSNHN